MPCWARRPAWHYLDVNRETNLASRAVAAVPPHFSWIDHRLVRADYLRRADAKEWALYVVHGTVGDEHGVSYYGDGTLGRLLSLTDLEVATARGELAAAGIIAYEKPLYQVLALEGLAGRKGAR